MNPIVLLALFSFACSVALAGFAWYWIRAQRQQAQEFSQALLSATVRHDRLQQTVERLQRRADDAETESRELAQRFQAVESHAGVCVPPKPAVSGFNINRRVEVIRMFHDGYSEEAIAEELMTPLGEVRLLIHLEKNSKQAKEQSVPRRSTRRAPTT